MKRKILAGMIMAVMAAGAAMGYATWSDTVPTDVEFQGGQITLNKCEAVTLEVTVACSSTAPDNGFIVIHGACSNDNIVADTADTLGGTPLGNNWRTDIMTITLDELAADQTVKYISAPIPATAGYFYFWTSSAANGHPVTLTIKIFDVPGGSIASVDNVVSVDTLEAVVRVDNVVHLDTLEAVVRVDNVVHLDTVDWVTGGHIGISNFIPSVVDVTMTVDTAAYAANEVLADVQEVTIPNSATRIEIYGAVVVDADYQGQALTIVIFDATATLGTENAAISISDADAADVAGIIAVGAGDYTNLVNSYVAGASCNIQPVYNASSKLYVGLVSNGTGTYASGGIKVRLRYKQF